MFVCQLEAFVTLLVSLDAHILDGYIIGGSPRWITQLELKTVIKEVSDDLAVAPDWNLYDGEESEEQEFIKGKYPGN